MTVELCPNRILNLALVLTVGLTALGCSPGPRGGVPQDTQAAVHRPRPVICNDDGDDAWNTDAPATPEGFLSGRIDQLKGTGVSTVFYCTTQSFNLYTHNSRLSEVYTDTELNPHNRVAALIQQGTDPLALAVDFCRKNDLEVFFTLRMNDIHDNWFPQFLSQWKKDHLQCLVGKRSDLDTYAWADQRSIWSPVDYACPEVRERTVAIVRDVAERYDVAGIDLDYLRHTCYFKETQRGEPATREQVAMLTDMMQQIREVVREAGQKKGRNIMVSARVFSTFALNRYFGFDVRQWAERGYVDFLALGGGYDPFTSPAGEMVKWCHGRGMPVYACLSQSGMEERDVKGTYLGQEKYAAEAWLGAASNAWAQGVDGIMTFNLHPTGSGAAATLLARRVLSAIADPVKLRYQDKLFCIDNVGYALGLGYMMNSVPVDGRLPITVNHGETVARVFPVGDNIPAAGARVEKIHLRLGFTNRQEMDQLEVTLNGSPVALAWEAPGWLTGDIPSHLLQHRENQLAVSFISGPSLGLSWGAAEMLVKYAP